MEMAFQIQPICCAQNGNLIQILLDAYSYTAVGSEMQHFDILANEINNKVFFAGEHTEIDYFSTAHGAYLSGIREADKIIDLL
jgi:monoamine oxidase